jgi:hypothetical protein
MKRNTPKIIRGRKGQMGAATYILAFFFIFSFVTYMFGWDTPLFFSLSNCLTQQGTCPEIGYNQGGVNITGLSLPSIFLGLVVLAIGTGLAISLTGTSFPNPYWYFAPAAIAIAIVGFTIPSKIFTTGYGLPEPMRLLIAGLYSMVIGISAFSWLKGGGQP